MIIFSDKYRFAIVETDPTFNTRSRTIIAISITCDSYDKQNVLLLCNVRYNVACFHIAIDIL